MKLEKVNTQKNEKINKTTTFLVPVGRFSPEVKTAAKTLLKPYVLKLEKKETPEIQITVVKTQNKKRLLNEYRTLDPPFNKLKTNELLLYGEE